MPHASWHGRAFKARPPRYATSGDNRHSVIAAGLTAPRLLLRANDRATIHLVRDDNRNLGIGSSGSRQDFSIGKELVRGKSGIEHDEVLLPQGIESVTLDGIEHGHEILFLVQIVRSVDLVDTSIVFD